MTTGYRDPAGIRNAGICIIYDEPARESSLQLAAQLGLRPVALGTATAGPRQRDAVIVDVDITSPHRAQQVRSVMHALDKHVPRLFAVESGAELHAATVQAHALGATRILRRPLRASQLRDEIEATGVRIMAANGDGDIEAQPGGVSIKAAARLLDTAFGSLVAGTPLDLGQASAASKDLLSGVRQAGLGHWLDTVQAYHTGTFQHCLLVTGATVAFALEAGISESSQLTLVLAGLLHDIGKAEIPLDVLDKPGKLTPAEFEIIKRHPIIGRDYLNRFNPDLPADVVAAVTHHHEYLDGTGYPHQLQGYEIEPLSRILTVCDIYGALIERRSYKPPKTPAEAMLILEDMAAKGKVDPVATDVLSSAVLKTS
jgi:putative nucleotidyltransferase with HDIG domain